MANVQPTGTLRSHLNRRNASLARQTDSIIATIKPLLWYSIASFPTGTKHTPEHTLQVERIADMLLSARILKKLTDDELSMILLACHIHDLGMVGTESDNESEESREQLRHKHAVSIEKTIQENWKAFGFSDEISAEVLGQICRGHRPPKVSGVASWSDIPEHRTIGPCRTVRPRLISAVIYACDELHIGSDRAPKREQGFIDITSRESNRHWRLHQSISGPSVVNNRVLFDIQKIDTFSTERELRSVLKKAFLACQDLRRELAASGISDEILPLSIQWNRTPLWELQLLHHFASGVSSLDSASEAILNAFHTKIKTAASLDDLCEQRNNSDSEVRTEISRVFSGLRSQAIIIPVDENAETFQLSIDQLAFESAIKTAKAADVSERLFGNDLVADNVHRLHSSNSGKGYIRNHLLARIRSAYGLNVLSDSSFSNLRTVLEHSPTACHTILNTPPPFTLRDRFSLLLLAATTGLQYDIHSNPTILLDSAFRSAATAILKEASSKLPDMLRFGKELAVTLGFSEEQVRSLLTPSHELSEERSASVAEGKQESLHLTVSHPDSKPGTSFSHLMLAGSRCGMPFSIVGTTDFPILVKSDRLVPLELGDTPDVAQVTIAPGRGLPTSYVTIRARPVVDRENRKLTLDGVNLGAPGTQDEYPLIVSVSTKPSGSTVSVSIDLCNPSLRICTFLTLRAGERLGTEWGQPWQITLGGKALGQALTGTGNWNFDNELLDCFEGAEDLRGKYFPWLWRSRSQPPELIFPRTVVFGHKSGHVRGVCHP